ncbi:MAG: response regulator, partial [Micromonosporaceae bacterium]
MIRVVIVDDQQLVRTGIRSLLERSDDITVVGDADDGASGVRLVVAERPDVVLMDIRMPGMDGLKATRQIIAKPRLRDVRVIMLTTFDTDDHIFEAIRVGAAGFLLKDTTPEELRRAVRVAAAGEALLSPSVTRRVMDAATRPHRPASSSPALQRLTTRERELLTQVAT